MELKQNPFSLYDFLGYFTPGALFLYAIIFGIELLSPHAHSASIPISKSILSQAEMYVPFVLVAYTIGHLLSFISSITVERFSIWSKGYPSNYLLALHFDGFWKTTKKGIFLLRLPVAIFLLPISLLDAVVGHWLGLRFMYAKRLDKLLRAIIKRRVFDLVVNELDEREPSKHGYADEHDYFRFVYHYTVEHAPHHLPKMQNYVALYGFLRTVTLLVVLAFWAELIAAIWCAHIPNHWLAISMIATSILAYLFFLSFEKFYRRFSLEALMAVTVCCKRTA